MLGDAEAVRQVAFEGARALICDEVKRGLVDLSHRIEVDDEAGHRVLVLPFDEAFEILGRRDAGT